MKFFRLLVVLAILVAVVPSVSAAGPAGSWASGISCTNLGASSTTLTLAFYKDDGTLATSYTDTTALDAGKTRGYYTPSSFPTLPSNFVGSAVVSATQPLACNVNTQTATGNGSAANPYRIGTSAGFNDTQAAATMYVPQVVKAYGGFNSYIAVQNTSGADVTVEVSYKDKNGNAVGAATESRVIKAYSNTVFYQSDNTNIPSNFIGAATVKATSPNTTKLGVTVNMYNSGSDSTTAQFLSYNGFADGGTLLYVPSFRRNYYGYNGGMTIQNIGGSATTVTITFKFANGGTYTYNSPSINAGAALFLYATNITDLAPVDLAPTAQRFGSAEIQSNTANKVVAIVNEDNRGGAGIPIERIGQGMTYNAIADGSQTAKMVFPQIANKAGGVFSGGFQVANTTNTAGTCTITFTSDANATKSGVTLPAKGAITVFAPDFPKGETPLVDAGYNAGVEVTCTQPIVGIANFAADAGTGKVGDSLTTSNGLNVTP